MPKLPDLKIYERGEIENLDCVVRVNVDSEGTFSFSIPEKVNEVARRFLEVNGATYPHAKIVFTVGSYRLIERDLKRGETCLRALFKEYLLCHHTTEEVIAYRYFRGVSYYKGADGKLYPHGCDVEGGGWVGASSTDHQRRQHEKICGNMVGFEAFVLVKNTYKRASSTKVEFERWRHPDNHHSQPDDPREVLNEWSNGDAPEKIDETGSRSDWTVIPYTPEAAIFFAKVVKGLCSIDDKLSTFFADKTRVLAAIEDGTPLKLL